MAYPDQISSRTIRQLLLLTVIFLLAYFLYAELHFMLAAFLGAIALYVLLRQPMFKLVYDRRWPRWLAATLLMFSSFLVIVLPLSWVVGRLIEEFTPFLKDTTAIQNSILQIDHYLTDRYKINILSQATMDKIPSVIASIGTKLIGATLSTLMNLVIMYFVLWFLLMHCNEIERWIRHKIPLKNTNTMQLLRESQHVVLSNTIGIPVLGVVQGIVAMIGYYMFNVEKPILWGIITGVASVIPFVGTMAAWIPLSVLTFARGDTENGYWIFAWGLLVIGSSDNIFRMILQKYTADIHPLITVFGVIIGLNMFGFLGLIFGPLLISLFMVLVRIYYDEYVTNHDAPEHAEDHAHVHDHGHIPGEASGHDPNKA